GRQLLKKAQRPIKFLALDCGLAVLAGVPEIIWVICDRRFQIMQCIGVIIGAQSFHGLLIIGVGGPAWAGKQADSQEQRERIRKFADHRFVSQGWMLVVGWPSTILYQ